jgi:hypothetical protein
MRTIFLPILSFFLIISTFAKSQNKDVIDNLSGFFKTAEAQKISEYFSSAVELNILAEENSYSKAQAEIILRDFFFRNKPLSVKILHRLSSNPDYKLAVLSLQTAKDNFRVSISLTSNGERFLINEIRIEFDKQ